MVEVDILPGCWLMATSAIRTKLPAVRIFRGMTGITTRGGVFIFSVDMAGRTRDTAVTAGQREAGPAVIEIDILPVSRVMTIGAVASHLPGVNIFMTRCAIGRRILEQKIVMATFTCGTGMFANQLEGGCRMVEGHILPGCGCMTRFAILPQHVLVWIILLMTGEAIRWRLFEYIIAVTILAGCIDMCRQQFKDRTVMVKVNFPPIVR